MFGRPKTRLGKKYGSEKKVLISNSNSLSVSGAEERGGGQLCTALVFCLPDLSLNGGEHGLFPAVGPIKSYVNSGRALFFETLFPL